jgi:hypothetical protein
MQIVNKIWNFVVVPHIIQYRNSANFSYTQWWPHWDKLRAFISCYSNDASSTELATTISRFLPWYPHEVHHLTMAVRPLLIGQYNTGAFKKCKDFVGRVWTEVSHVFFVSSTKRSVLSCVLLQFLVPGLLVRCGAILRKLCSCEGQPTNCLGSFYLQLCKHEEVLSFKGRRADCLI